MLTSRKSNCLLLAARLAAKKVDNTACIVARSLHFFYVDRLCSLDVWGRGSVGRRQETNMSDATRAVWWSCCSSRAGEQRG